MGHTHGMRRALGTAAICVLVGVGCSSGDDDADATEAALAAEIALEPGHELVGRLVVDLDDAGTPEIDVAGDERSFTVPVDGAATHHEIPIAGLRAEQDYTVTVRAGTESVELELRTGALPDDLPELEVETADPARMSDGFTLFNMLDLTDVLGDGSAEATSEDPPRSGYLVAVDAEGEIVWYHRTNHPIGDARQLDDGTILHEYNDTGARRIDLFGQTLEEWGGQIISGPLSRDSFDRPVLGDSSVEVATDAMHHEVGMLDNGNLVALSTELRTYEGFPAGGLCGEGESFGGSYDLIVDVVVEFTPDGEIVAEYPLADHFDPVGDPRDQNVCGLPFDEVFPNWLYRAQGFAEALDWTHANGVVEDPTGEYFTVSVRHLDAILQIERATGDLAWRFGPGGDFTIEDPADFPSFQHAPEWQYDGSLLLYDNGNQRAAAADAPDGAPPFSRAAQYRLDPETGTAELVWERVSTIDGEPTFAAFVGDADRMANGNVLVTDGGYADRPDGVTAQITEVVPDESGTGGEVVFDLRIADTERTYAIYRAERLGSFYPAA